MRTLLLTFIVFTCFFAGTTTECAAQKGRHIKWGRGGLHWVIYENRQVYRLDMEGQQTGQGGMWDKRGVESLFDDFDRLKFEKIISNNRSGDFYMIKYISTKGNHQVAWVDPSDLGKKKHSIIYFYGMLKEFESPPHE
jgi:hypothetical protein